MDLSTLNEYYENLFDANKYPLQEGESYFYSGPTFNEQTLQWYTTPIPVSFSLEGPWDFSQGPVDETLVETSKNASSDPNHADFPGATYVTYQGWKLGTDSYYCSEDAAAVYDHGWVEDSTYLGRNIYIYTYSAPNLLLYFPIKIGQTWESNYGILQDGKQIGNISKRKTVLSKNRIVVPAGTYDDAYLIQSKGSQVWQGVPKSFCGYIWYVPYVGRVAYISSLDNEPNEVFVQAKIFERLKYTTYSKPEKVEEVGDQEQPVGKNDE